MIKLFLIVLMLLSGCAGAVIEKNVYISTDGAVTVTYTTTSDTKVDAKDVGKATLPIPLPF